MTREELDRKVNLLKEKVGDGLFHREDCYKITTIETLLKYHKAVKVEYTETREVPLQEVVNLLNDAIGNDGWFESDLDYWWEYKVINNKICEVNHYKGYRLV